MTGAQRPWWRPRFDGLAVRVAALLTFALLPLGLIALHQTREYQRESVERAELSLLALTGQGASAVQQAIEQALGAGEALGVVADLLDDPAICSDYLSRFVRNRDQYRFVGFLPAEGPVTCASEGARLAALDVFDRSELVADPAVRVRATPRDGPPAGRALIVLIPIRPGAGDGSPGYLALAIPLERIVALPLGVSELEPLDLITFDASGHLLTTRGSQEGSSTIAGLLPERRGLAMEARGGPRVFAARSGEGNSQVYSVTPLVRDVAYAMAIWSPEQAGRRSGSLGESPLLFPLLMWVASLVVAFWAIHRLVIRWVARLGERMRRFGLDRSLPDRSPGLGAPHELREIEEAFRHMAHAILHDEARMENAFRERGVLLREVHHRVKNNLQLISSIISMQVRRLPEPRARAILRRLQDRVLTLAAIYRSLYTSPDLGDVNAAPVLRAIVEQELRGATDRVEAVLDIEDMVLDPDKVVPLAFLTAEAVSNALASARAAEGRPSLSVTLQRDGDSATLRIANSVSSSPAGDEPGRGLGQHLIHAFAAQVGGPVVADSRSGLYSLSVTFPVATEPAEIVAA